MHHEIAQYSHKFNGDILLVHPFHNLLRIKWNLRLTWEYGSRKYPGPPCCGKSRLISWLKQMQLASKLPKKKSGVGSFLLEIVFYIFCLWQVEWVAFGLLSSLWLSFIVKVLQWHSRLQIWDYNLIVVVVTVT